MRPETLTRYPLSWPVGWRRTPASARVPSRFSKVKTNYHASSQPGGQGWTSRNAEDLSIYQATDRLRAEVRRLTGDDGFVLSTNVETRLDGTPRSDRRAPTDPGAACYFRLNRADRVLACDRYTTVAGNIAAIAAHIDALRAIDRYGVGTLEQAFAGYTALPSPAADWRSVFGFNGGPVTLDAVESMYRQMARQSHPDIGGSDADMARLNVAMDSARAELSR